MVEEDVPEDRDIAEDGNAEGLDLDRKGLADEGLAHDAGDAEAEHGEGEAGNDLVGPEAYRDEGVERRGQGPGRHRAQGTEEGVPGDEGHDEAGHRPEGHHALDPEVHDARAFRDDLPRGTEKERSAGDQGPPEDRYDDRFHQLFPFRNLRLTLFLRK